MRIETTSGSSALAQSAVAAGVSFVSAYAGAPVTTVVDRIVAMTSADDVRVEWAANEKIAVEMVYGASLAGARALLCIKSVGLNLALDPLMAINHTGCCGGLVVLVGDDPGGWGSQNEQDSRAVALATQLAVLEPASVADAAMAMRQAFELSEKTGMPVILRVTRALVESSETLPLREPQVLPVSWSSGFRHEFMRRVVLPVNVVSRHSRLLDIMENVRSDLEHSPLNGVAGNGRLGIVAAGFSHRKLMDLLGGTVPAELRILRLGTFSPMPHGTLRDFLGEVDRVLVLEETAPLVERALRGTAQKWSLCLQVAGRDTDHLPRTGELFAPQIAAALSHFAPDLPLPAAEEGGRHMPSKTPLCEGCPYIPTFDALTNVMARMGGRGAFVVVGDPGCMVRAQQEPYRLLDVKTSLGSSIATATGIAASLQDLDVANCLTPDVTEGRKPLVRQRVIALCGDSGLLHSGFGGLLDAARIGVGMTVIVLDNGSAALTGGQPHAASEVDARGIQRPAVDLAALSRAAGVHSVRSIDVQLGEDLRDAIAEGIESQGTDVIIARGECPRWPSA